MVIAMDYKKKYKDLLERARKLRDKNCDGCKMCMESLFDELAESEDKEIRHAMINFFKSERIKDGIAVLHFGVNIEKMIAWLEKQAPKSKWSDDEQYLLVCKNALRKYQVSDKWDADIISKWLEDIIKQREQKPKWSEEDEGMMSHCIGAIHIAGKQVCNSYTAKDKEQMKNWLKSLKQRMEE